MNRSNKVNRTTFFKISYFKYDNIILSQRFELANNTNKISFNKKKNNLWKFFISILLVFFLLILITSSSNFVFTSEFLDILTYFNLFFL